MENLENKDLEVVEELDDEEELTEEEMAELLEMLQQRQNPKIEINVDAVQNQELDKEEFNRAIKDMSYLCGQISALRAVGCTPAMALDYLLAKDGIEFTKLME